MGNKSSKITTSHWGAFNVFVENGRIINTEPFHADPAPPNISQLVPNAVHHSKRIDQPYVRKGWLEKTTTTKRGNDEYVPLAWEDAIDLAAKELIRVKNNYGNVGSGQKGKEAKHNSPPHSQGTPQTPSEREVDFSC